MDMRCDTWNVRYFYQTGSLKLFENRALREIFGRKGVEVKGDRRKIHNKELYYL
jgi:hypothetical protein